MSARPTRTTRTTGQRFVDNLAMSFFRNELFTPADVKRADIRMQPKVQARLSGYDMRTSTRTCEAYPRLVVTGEQGSRTLRAWFAQLASVVLVHRIIHIVGFKPRFSGMKEDLWIFLGGDIRDLEVYPLSGTQLALPQENDGFVEYWVRRDGQQVVVRYNDGSDVGRVLDEEPCNRHVKEAFRRAILALA